LNTEKTGILSDMEANSQKRVVLLGGGHAHVEVISRLGSLGLSAGTTLVSPSRYAPYSGMLPGYIAGQYAFEDFNIDLEALCQHSRIAFHEGLAVGLDSDARRVRLEDGAWLDYDLLSLDIGSTPILPKGISAGVSVKPIASFTERLGLLDAMAKSTRSPLRLAVVGQGVAGVEVALALKTRLDRIVLTEARASGGVELHLVGRSSGLIPERGRMARIMVEKALSERGIAHHPAFDVVAVEDKQLVARDGRRLEVDEVVWTTSSGAPRWLRQTGLALDPDGFIRVDAELRSLSHPNVFAAGDVASLVDPRPKAGVFAVRAGPVLAENLRRALTGEALTIFRPQGSWLVLISLADGQAIADKWGLSVSGRWVNAWKRWIDARFIRRFQR
jgi:pyridine nucleotide-disulfide oxidoreductase family protein